MLSRRLNGARRPVSTETLFKTETRDGPTVNKNGHRENVLAGVCNLGSSSEMNGWGAKYQRGPYAHVSIRTFIRV